MLATDAQSFGVVDEVVPEPHGGAHRDPATAANGLRDSLRRALATLDALSPAGLVDARYAKFRAMGVLG